MGSPWTNQAVSLIILTEQATGFSGLFGYSPVVGAGNLIFSVSAAAGIDPYGNSYPQGVSSDVGAVTTTALTTNSVTVNSGPLLFYTSEHAGGTVFTAGQSGNWTVPANVTSATGTLIGGGNDGALGGGGGGECAVQTFTVTPGGMLAYSVGNDAQDTTFNGITAHAGKSDVNGGAGGTGSTATTHFDGGAGGRFDGSNFQGGGSSAGPSQAGNAGNSATGGAAVPGGGAGGNPSANGSAPGGGGGGNGGLGAGGQLTINYSGSSGPDNVLMLSIAAAAGMDGFGNTWEPGLTLDSTAVPPTPSAGCILYYNTGTLSAVGPSGVPVALAAT